MVLPALLIWGFLQGQHVKSVTCDGQNRCDILFSRRGDDTTLFSIHRQDGSSVSYPIPASGRFHYEGDPLRVIFVSLGGKTKFAVLDSDTPEYKRQQAKIGEAVRRKTGGDAPQTPR